MTSLNAFTHTARQRLQSILNYSGTILYSSCETLKPGKYYFLGLNPGGSEENTITINEALAALASGTPKTNAYIHEDWGSPTRRYGVGGHPLQQNYRYLFEELGVDINSVCASNLIFTRSVGERGAGGLKRAELCWPVHEAMLAIVRPAAIITFGRQSFSFILSKVGGSHPEELWAGHGSWKWKYSTLNTGTKLIGLPHLSRYALRNHPKVVEEIRTRVG